MSGNGLDPGPEVSSTFPAVRFLASVTTLDEARICLEAGADIIDCKDPTAGALGALNPAVVAAVRAATPRRFPVSATVGDLPAEPERVAAAASEMAAAGADFVKIGFFPGGDAEGTAIAAVKAVPRPAQLVGVLFADLAPDFGLISKLAAAGFAGILLDTARKSTGRDSVRLSLTRFMGPGELCAFVAMAQSEGLFAGLAGSLNLADIPLALAARPDILGFRGALCARGQRGNSIRPEAVSQVRKALDAGRQVHKMPRVL